MTTHLRFIVEGVAQGHSSVSSNPLRAGLGALAVAVAVATIVVVVTALDGLGRYARTAGARAFGATRSSWRRSPRPVKSRGGSSPRSSSATRHWGGPIYGSSNATPATTSPSR